MEKLNIIIVNTQPVPSSGNGAASVNRILSYTKGLVDNGNNVRILSTAPSPNNSWQKYDGIEVKHLGTPAGNIIKRILHHLVTSLRLIRALQKENKDVIIFVTSNYFLTILLELYAKFSGTKIVNEKSEYPFVIMSNNIIKRLFAPIYTNTAYRLLDGMIIMTKPLMEYYSNRTSNNCRFLEVPMTVDTSRFRKSNNTSDSDFGTYAAYCGNMGGNKDGLKNLLKAFSLVEKRGYPLKLLLIGGSKNQSEYDELVNLNEQLGNQNVVFFGGVDREKMPSLLQGAAMLVLARPSSLQSTGGFPTKLGEYLSTGNPVVVTSVGDIPLYLTDKVNAYVVKPDDDLLFADAMCHILDNEKEAKLVGAKGQLLANTVFNGEYQAKRIEFFLKEIISDNNSNKYNLTV